MIPADSIADNDCLRVATASILELNPRRVPNFVKRRGWWFDVWSDWLRERGFIVMPHRIRTLADAPRGYWIAIVDPDPTDDWSHALVMRGRRVAYDPTPELQLRRNYVIGYTLEPV